MDLFILSQGGLIPLLECTVLDTVKDATCTGFAQDGKVYVTSCEYHCIHVLNESGQQIRPVIGRHGKGKLEFIGPKQVVCRDDKVYVMETFGNRIHIFEEASGQFISFFNMSTAHRMARAFCVDHNGIVYVATDRRSICVYDPSGILLNTFDTGLNRALTGIALDGEEGTLHVSYHNGVRVFSIQGDHLRDYASEQWTTALTVLSNGLALVCSKGCLSVYSSSGRLLCDYRGLFYPYHVIMAPDESIWVTCEEGIIVLPHLCLPPFSLPLQCNRTILLQMDHLPVSLLPPSFGRVFSEWSHPLHIDIYDRDKELLRSDCVNIKPGIPLPVVRQYVCFKLNLPTNCFWYKDTNFFRNSLCLRDGTFDQEWINIKKFYISIIFKTKF